MTIMSGLVLTIWTLLYCTCFAMPDVHKRMTKNQLQSIFHVDNYANIPNYELIELIHHGTESHSPEAIINKNHRRKRRSIQNNIDINGKNVHHVKKDLSKTPYYSELKQLRQQNDFNSLSDKSYSDKLKNLDLSDIKEHNVTLSAFGEQYNLTLKQIDGLFKDGPESLRMWMVRSEPNATQGVEYDEIHEEPIISSTEEIGEVFQDEKNMAAILMRRQLQTGDLMMEGSIGHELVIKPLPRELSQNKDKTHHIIYKRSMSESDKLSDFAYMEPDRLEMHYRKKRSATQNDNNWNYNDEELEASETQTRPHRTGRKARAAPYIIYPEILVIVDYDGYRLHGGDNVQVKRYFVSFWNGVDLRYRLLKGPRIRISIAGIIISRGRDATPYLERNRVGRDAIDSAAALTDMGKYLFRERRLPVYDIAVAITKYDMCRRRKGGRCTKGTAGFAYVGGACVVNKRLEKVNSVAIIEDTGGFSGIIVAAHEVGHLLGAVHDGSPPPSYLGGPGAERCRWEDGYIMSDLRHTERGFRWSPCTIQSFHHFLNGDTASCLHNAPHEDSALGRSLPGTLLSLDAQCRRDRGTYACFKDDRVCAQLFCFDSQTGYCVAYRPAAEGSSCGNGVHCLDGRCVAAYSNVIPNYRAYNAENGEEDDDEDDGDDIEDDDEDEDDDDEIPVGQKDNNRDSTLQFTVPNNPLNEKIQKRIVIKTSLVKEKPENFEQNSEFSTPTTTTTTTTDSLSIKNIENIQIENITEENKIQVHDINKQNNISLTTNTTNTILKKPFNSFYYNLLKLKQNHNLSVYFNNNNRNKTKIIYMRKPYDYFLYNNNNNNNNKNNKIRLSTINNSNNYSSTTPAMPTSQPVILSTTINNNANLNENFNIDDNYHHNEYDYLLHKRNLPPLITKTTTTTTTTSSTTTSTRPPPTHRSYIFGGRSTTRSTSSLIDSYFRKLSSTRTTTSTTASNKIPIEIYYDNQHQYYRRNKSGVGIEDGINDDDINNRETEINNNNNNNNHPSYSNNYLGDNTNHLPINVAA